MNDGELDNVKTDAGKRDVPLDGAGMMTSAFQSMWQRSKFHRPDDLVFANQAGNPLDTHNLLHRHIKPAAVKLGLPKTVDFRSFRKMHASLLRRTGARPEIMRDNLGHAEIGIGLNVYSESWWDARVWMGRGEMPMETGLWWCRAEKPFGALSDWDEPIQIMTGEDCGWHAGSWKPSLQFAGETGRRAFVFFDGSYRTTDPGPFRLHLLWGVRSLNSPLTSSARSGFQSEKHRQVLYSRSPWMPNRRGVDCPAPLNEW